VWCIFGWGGGGGGRWATLFLTGWTIERKIKKKLFQAAPCYEDDGIKSSKMN